MVKIRLRKVGKRSQEYFNIIVIDSRKSNRSKYIQKIGHYSPHNKDMKNVDIERVESWVKKGAQLSKTVKSIIKRKKNDKT